MVDFRIIVDVRINETLQAGAVANRTYQVRDKSVYLFSEFIYLGLTQLNTEVL